MVDYKTDRLEGVPDVEAELLARYGAQVGQYQLAWQQASGTKSSARLVSVKPTIQE